MGKIANITSEADFLQEGSTPILVDFYADWCGPCQAMSPALHAIADEENVLVFKVDIEKHQDLASKYNVHAIPMLMTTKNGKVIESVTGLQSKKNLLDMIGRANAAT